MNESSVMPASGAPFFTSHRSKRVQHLLGLLVLWGAQVCVR